MRTIRENLIFRCAKEDDANELFNLLNSLSEAEKKYFHPHPFDIQTIIDICSSIKDHYFVLEQNEKIIGYSFLRLFGYKIPSFGCCVREEYQGKGYGTSLSRETLNRAKDLKYHKVILKVYKENNTALRMYKNIGFKIVGETDDKRQYKMEINFPPKD